MKCYKDKHFCFVFVFWINMHWWNMHNNWVHRVTFNFKYIRHRRKQFEISIVFSLMWRSLGFETKSEMINFKEENNSVFKLTSRNKEIILTSFKVIVRKCARSFARNNEHLHYFIFKLMCTCGICVDKKS